MVLGRRPGGVSPPDQRHGLPTRSSQDEGDRLVRTYNGRGNPTPTKIYVKS